MWWDPPDLSWTPSSKKKMYFFKVLYVYLYWSFIFLCFFFSTVALKEYFLPLSSPEFTSMLDNFNMHLDVPIYLKHHHHIIIIIVISPFYCCYHINTRLLSIISLSFVELINGLILGNFSLGPYIWRILSFVRLTIFENAWTQDHEMGWAVVNFLKGVNWV